MLEQNFTDACHRKDGSDDKGTAPFQSYKFATVLLFSIAISFFGYYSVVFLAIISHVYYLSISTTQGSV